MPLSLPSPCPILAYVRRILGQQLAAGSLDVTNQDPTTKIRIADRLALTERCLRRGCPPHLPLAAPTLLSYCDFLRFGDSEELCEVTQPAGS